jgi:hypothetical protein
MKRVVIPYFPSGMKFVTPVIFGVAIYLFTIGYSAWATTLALLAVIILTTKYVTEINLDKKQYRDYLSFLWIPLQEEKTTFRTVNRIVIAKENISQMLNSRIQSRQLDWAQFTGTLVYDDVKTLELLTRNDKRELLMGLKEFASLLQVDIEDQSTSHHYIVDLKKI